MKLATCILTSILAICTASAYAESIFPNGHFENGFDGWTTDYDDGDSNVRIDSWEREHYAVISAGATASYFYSPAMGYASISSFFIADAGQSLILDFKETYLRTSGYYANASGRIEILDYTGTPIFVRDLETAASDWINWTSGIFPYTGQYCLNISARVDVDVDLSTPPNPLSKPEQTSAVFLVDVDNVSLVPEPSSLMLFGIGVISLCFFSKKWRKR